MIHCHLVKKVESSFIIGDIIQSVLYNITTFYRKECSAVVSWFVNCMQYERSLVRARSQTLYARLKNNLLFQTCVKYALSTSKRLPMFCGHGNWMMTRRTLPHPKPIPKTRTPKNGESLGRCNHTNMTSKGRHWLRCVLSGKEMIF